MDFKLVSMLIWAAILFVPPLALAVAAPLFYADANEKAGGRGKLNNGWFALLFLCGLIVWAALLKLVYLPAMSFDLGNPRGYNYGDFANLGLLWQAFTGWVQVHTASALALLIFPVALAAAIMAYARYMGFTSRLKELRSNPLYRYYNYHS